MYFMYIGFTNYQKVQEGMSKVKGLFIIQFLVVLFLLFVSSKGAKVTDFYVILLLTHYGYFLSFSVVIDSCQDEEQH